MGVTGSGTNPRPEDTVRIAAVSWVARWSVNAAIRRMGPRRFAATQLIAAGLVRGVQVLGDHDADHRNVHVQAEMFRDFRRSGDGVRVGGVDLDGVDAGLVGGDLVEQFGAASTDDDGVAEVVESRAEAEVRGA